jgi:hypothetical protein
MWHALLGAGTESEHDRADTNERTREKAIGTGGLLASIRDVVRQSRKAVAYGINTARALTNYEIGRLIVEHEQKGAVQAEHAEETLKLLDEANRHAKPSAPRLRARLNAGLGKVRCWAAPLVLAPLGGAALPPPAGPPSAGVRTERAGRLVPP